MKGKLIKGKLLLTLTERGEKTRNGIIIPDVVDKRHKEGVVEMIGQHESELKVGDLVYFNAAGTKLKIDEKEYLLLNERDVLYIV